MPGSSCQDPSLFLPCLEFGSLDYYFSAEAAAETLLPFILVLRYRRKELKKMLISDMKQRKKVKAQQPNSVRKKKNTIYVCLFPYMAFRHRLVSCNYVEQIALVACCNIYSLSLYHSLNQSLACLFFLSYLPVWSENEIAIGSYSWNFESWIGTSTLKLIIRAFMHEANIASILATLYLQMVIKYFTLVQHLAHLLNRSLCDRP